MNLNYEISIIFRNIASILTILNDNPFKIRAYNNASLNISNLDYEIDNDITVEDLVIIEGIGKDLASKIIEYKTTGKISYYEELKNKIPLEVIELLNIKGVGPKLASELYNKFDVKSFSDLEKLIDNKSIFKIKGIGERKLNDIVRGIEIYKESKSYVNLGIAHEIAETIRNKLLTVKGVKYVRFAGSLRRMKETIKKISLVILCNNENLTIKKIQNSNLFKNMVTCSNHTISYQMQNGINIELSFCNNKNFSTILFYKTGSDEHVKNINSISKEHGLKLDKNGLYKGKKRIELTNEKNIYSILSLQYIPPELRENNGEIEAARNENLPKLIEFNDIKGDLHIHSTWSDGKSGVVEMTEIAKKLGYEYIAITDHSPSSVIANGLSIERLYKRTQEIKKLKNNVSGIKILLGTEVDIKLDGTLDYPDDVLKDLDIVVASVHSGFKMNKDDMTERILSALRNPYVHALGHPTGRLIGERDPYQLDIDAVIDIAKKHNKALEINSSPYRLDLKDVHIRKVIKSGVKLIISTDAHHINQLSLIIYGIGTARRGWATKKDILNTFSYNKLKEWLQRK